MATTTASGDWTKSKTFIELVAKAEEVARVSADHESRLIVNEATLPAHDSRLAEVESFVAEFKASQAAAEEKRKHSLRHRIRFLLLGL